MNVAVHIPRDRFVAEVGQGPKALTKAINFVDKVLDDIEPDRVLTLYGSGDMPAVQKALDKNISVTAILAWKGLSPGKSNLIQFNKMWPKINRVFMNDDIGFGDGRRYYEQAQQEMVEQSDAFIIVWDGEYWNSAKTLCHMAIAANKPVALYLIRADKYVLLYNNTETEYSTEEMKRILNG